MEKFYYIGNIPKDIESFEKVIFGAAKEQRELSNGQIVVEIKEGIEESPEILKDFKKYSAKDILTEIDKIEGWV